MVLNSNLFSDKNTTVAADHIFKVMVFNASTKVLFTQLDQATSVSSWQFLFAHPQFRFFCQVLVLLRVLVARTLPSKLHNVTSSYFFVLTLQHPNTAKWPSWLCESARPVPAGSQPCIHYDVWSNTEIKKKDWAAFVNLNNVS